MPNLWSSAFKEVQIWVRSAEYFLTKGRAYCFYCHDIILYKMVVWLNQLSANKWLPAFIFMLKISFCSNLYFILTYYFGSLWYEYCLKWTFGWTNYYSITFDNSYWYQIVFLLLMTTHLSMLCLSSVKWNLWISVLLMNG